jgi:TP901 family phage tail tape measure protein
MADQNIVTNIVANADFSGLIADVNKVAASLSKLQAQIIQSDARLASQVATMNRSFGENLRRTGQFASHFVTLTSDVEKFGTNLDRGQMKLKQYFQTFQQHTKTQGGLIRDLARQQVALQNAIIQPMGKNAQGLMQYSVHIPQGLDAIKNKTAIARQELQIMNKVIQDGGVQMINWGKNTQWAGRQLTVGLTVPLAAFGVAASKAFREADAELVRLTKVYGGVAATSATELGKVRREVSETAREIAKAYGVSFKDTITLAADIAATGKQGNELLSSVKETSRLAVLGEVDRQEAMKATLAIQTTFKQNTEQLSESINFLNSVENQTSTSLADLIEAIPKAGPVIQGMGGSVKELALYMTAMKEGGINAAEGANALKSALASLINPTKVAKEKFSDMGIDLGGIVTNNAGNLTATILELQKALDSLDPLQKQQAIEQLFGKFQFARMNALFANLGKQGSQTLQVMDLMKASSAELAGVAGRELSMVTESASGKYRRALEGLKADLAGMGEEFLKIQTFFINVTDGIIKFIAKLPQPIKTILTFVTGLTAIIGPVIMLTGVLANFFGYIIKGASHFRSLFKGGEGWKMLTPEILAAQKAGSLVEATFYSDAKAATVLKTAIAGLVTEFELLQNKAMTGAVSVAPAMSTMAGNLVKGSNGRVVNPNHPLISPENTRSMSHLNPVAGMTLDQKSQQTIFGVVPGAPKVNQKIGNNPQMYMSGDLPKIPGLTSIGGASTGIVAAEAAKWHAMTGALAMQSQAEITLLKKEVHATGLITSSLSDSYQALLPTMTKLTANAATESAAIVAQLQAGKLTVDQARAKIIQLNAQVEAMIAQASVDIAGQQGRSIGLTNVPLLNQPVVNNAGKSNMKELLRPGRTRDLLNKIAGGLGVKTFGAGYSTETTIPKRLATGGVVYRKDGSDGPEFKPMGTDTVPAMLTEGEFVVKKDAVNKETLPFLKSLNETGSARPFLSATMIHQGTEANQALSRKTPPSFLTGSYMANDMSSLHSRGLHPMALFYDQGIRLGYDRKDLKRALNAAYVDLQGSFSRKGDAPINNAYYEKVATSVAMKHLKTVSRYSPRIGRDVKLAEELIFMGHQRNAQNKGIEPGSLRTTGFDGTELPRHLVGTGSGFSGQANQTHFNLAQELYDEKPSNLYTGKLGKGNTLSQAFGAQRGHIGAKFTPSRWNMLLNMVRSKIGRAPVIQDARSIALNKKWRGQGFSNGGPVYMANGGIVPGYSAGGMVPSTQYFEEGSDGPVGFRAGVRSQTDKGYLGKGMMSRREGGGLGMGAQMGIMMGGSMAGQAIGGTAGNMTMMAANILPWLPFQKILPLIKNADKSVGMLTHGLTLAGKAGGLLLRMLPGAAAIGAVYALYKGYQAYKKQLEETKREHIMLNGITEKGAKEAGISYKNIGNSIKDVREQLKLQKEAGLSAFESFAGTGVQGLTLTIAELKELKKVAKETKPELVGTFNSIDTSKVNDLAANLKAQFVSAGMSAQDATNQIYALIEASNKAGSGLYAITSTSFTAITDKGSAADAIVKSLVNSVRDIENIDSAAFASTIDTTISSLDAATKSLVGTKDAQGNIITQAKAIGMQYEKIVKLGANNVQIGQKALDLLKKERPELASILNSADTIYGMYAKWRIVLSGVAVDLKNITSEQALGIAAYQDALGLAAASASSNDNTNTASSLYKANKAAADLAKNIKSGENAVKNASKTEAGLSKAAIKDINDKIKKIRELADAKKKALSETVEAENTEIELKKLQLEAQSAIARGDKDSLATINLSIEQLIKQTHLKKASDSIDANAKKEEAAQQKLLDDDQKKKDATDAKINNYQKSGQSNLETLNEINAIRSALAKNAVSASNNQYTKDPKEKAENQKAIDGENIKIIKILEKSSEFIQNIFSDYVDPKTNKGKYTVSPSIPMAPGVPGTGNKAFDALVKEVGVGAKKNFEEMADSIKGGADLGMVTRAIGGTGATKVNQDQVSAAIKAMPPIVGAKGLGISQALKYGKDQTQDNGSLEDAVRVAVAKSLGLKAGQSFEFAGITYNVKKGGSVVRREFGGPVVAGQTYSVNDRINSLGVQEEGFTPYTSGYIGPNIDTMSPRYNIASGQVTGMRGAANSSSSNSNYSINIALNGTNVTADDVVKRFKQEMALVNAKEGRSRLVGGQS